MHMLSDQISNGFPPDKKLLMLELREYYQHRDHLSQVDGVPLYKGRVIIPECLRKFVLETLHSAHQASCANMRLVARHYSSNKRDAG